MITLKLRNIVLIIFSVLIFATRIKRETPLSVIINVSGSSNTERINSYFLDQIKSSDDPLWRQVVPTLEELDDFIQEDLISDPLNEEGDMPVPELVHRYPDRVLLMINNQCPVVCRFCTRKRKIGFPGIVTRETLRQGIEYIRNHSEIRDVIMSGGDPLLVPDKELDRILGELRSIPHLEILRIGTRVPGTLPARITEKLCSILK